MAIRDELKTKAVNARGRFQALLDDRNKFEAEYLEHYNGIAGYLMLGAPEIFKNNKMVEMLNARRQLRDSEKERFAANDKELDELLIELEFTVEKVDVLIKERAEKLSEEPLVGMYGNYEKAKEEYKEFKTDASLIDREISSKLPGFNGNMVYDYLKARGYGSTNYKAFILAKIFDGFFAKAVDYDKNQHNEEKLRELKIVNDSRLKKIENAYKAVADSLGISILKLEKEIGLTEHLQTLPSTLHHADELLNKLHNSEKILNEVSENMMATLTRAGAILDKFLHRQPTDEEKQRLLGMKEFAGRIMKCERDMKSTLAGILSSHKDRLKLSRDLYTKQGEAVRLKAHETNLLPKNTAAKR